jgi:hypothetical protein
VRNFLFQLALQLSGYTNWIVAAALGMSWLLWLSFEVLTHERSRKVIAAFRSLRVWIQTLTAGFVLCVAGTVLVMMFLSRSHPQSSVHDRAIDALPARPQIAGSCGA